MSGHPRLSRDLVASWALVEPSDGGIEVAPPETLALPEKVAQFGTGAFLRAFVEYFIDEANRQGRFNGSIVAIASTGSRRDAVLNAQDGLYTLAIQGMGEDGSAARQRYRIVSSLSRAISARDAWDDVLAVARNPSIELVVSNTTEIGIAFDETDRFDARPPRSYPGKLTRFLAERARAFDYDVRRGLVVLPCELVEHNGDTLRDFVRRLARSWSLDPRFLTWLDQAVVFCNTLVDRIVPGAPPRDQAERLERVLGYRDGLMTTCETYALFAIQGDEATRARLAFADADPCVVVTPDIRPYRERKVRILNGGHTISVPVALLAGLETVRDAVAHASVGRFMRRAMLDEIVPALDVPDAEGFARDALARFANPYIRHALVDITLYATTKMRVRVVPSIAAYAERFGRVPSSLAFGFAAHLAFARGELQTERRASGLPVPEDPEGDRIRAAWHDVDLHSDESIAEFARGICADETLWGVNLAGIDGFAAQVGAELVRIRRLRMARALDAHLAEPAPSLT